MTEDDVPQLCGFCGGPLDSDDERDLRTNRHASCRAMERAEVKRDERRDEEACR